MKGLGYAASALAAWYAASMLPWVILNPHQPLKDLQFMLALTLFFGTLIAVPSVLYVAGMETFSSQFPFPARLYIFIASLGFGLALLFGAFWWKQGSVHSASRHFFSIFTFIPFVPVVGIYLFRLLRRERA